MLGGGRDGDVTRRLRERKKGTAPLEFTRASHACQSHRWASVRVTVVRSVGEFLGYSSGQGKADAGVQREGLAVRRHGRSANLIVVVEQVLEIEEERRAAARGAQH